MLVSYTWLKELVAFEHTPDELAELLTRQGMTVDGLERRGRPYEHIVVGELLEVRPHANADTLSVCRVTTGKEELQVVCGAPGIKAGDRVAVALIGAQLGELKIKKTKLRGEESCGMCCAADELGLSDDHGSLLLLDKETAVGTPFEELVNGEDFIFNLDIANNRPDLLNHVGVAREIAAQGAYARGSNASYTPPAATFEEQGVPIAERVRVRVDAPELCPRYTARVVDKVAIGPSPLWMQARLYRLGMRPINNVVDITNYVLLEHGQPLHAFDARSIEGGTIVVRRARPGELIVTLDDAKRELDDEMLLIADEAKGIALAGVMGGANSEVSSATDRVLLESASFDGPNIRRTAKLLGLQSESSARFERNVRGSVLAASARAAQLLAAHAGGGVAPGVIDVDVSGTPATLEVDLRRCVSLLGLEIPAPDATRALETLGFSVQGGKADGLVDVTVPAHRVDIFEWPDIAEDLARLAGYDAIPVDTRVPFRSEAGVPRITRCRAKVADVLVGAGLCEAHNPSLVSPALLREAGVSEGTLEADPMVLANAQTKEQSVVRTILYPGLVRNLQRNIAQGAKAIRLFEIGRVYLKAGGECPFSQHERIGLLLWGAARDKGWWGDGTEIDLHDGTRLIEMLLSKLGINAWKSVAEARAACHPGRSAALVCADEAETRLGWIAELDPELSRALDIPGRTVVAELDLDVLSAAWDTVRPFTPLPRYPSATRDVALLVAERHTHQDICQAVKQSGAEYIESVRLFDLYRGEQIGAGQKSMAYRITYRAADRTLKDEEVDRAHTVVVGHLRKALEATIR
jgi:phenylalanyl-tRNA synthetase beta chain